MSACSIRRAYPPNIAEIRKVFPVSEGTIFSYAPHVYVPSGEPLSKPLEAHEAVHQRQQGDDPAAWWARYLTSPTFRFDQELEAHRAEMRAARGSGRNRARRSIARRLSSKLYGSMVTYQKALRLVR